MSEESLYREHNFKFKCVCADCENYRKKDLRCMHNSIDWSGGRPICRDCYQIFDG